MTCSGDRRRGPTRATRVTISAVIQLPWGIYVSPIFRYRSALPLHIWTGYDVNADGDRTTTSTRPRSVHRDRRRRATASSRRSGACETINCGRGAALSQFNLRVSRSPSSSAHGMNIEAIGEIFNMFNAINPNFGVGAASSSRFYTGTAANHRAELRCS